MNKSFKIGLGCFGSIIFVTGGMVGSLIQERIDKKTTNNNTNLDIELLKNYQNELKRVHTENEQLKIRIFSKQR